MKKTLRTELVSLAHKILQLKDTTSYEAMAAQASELYEKLALLAYAEKMNLGQTPSIGVTQVESLLQEVAKIEEDPDVNEPENSSTNVIPEVEEIEPELGSTIEETDELTQPIELVVEETIEEEAPVFVKTDGDIDELSATINAQSNFQKNDVFDIGGEYAQTPVFERVEPQIDELPKNLNDKLKTGLKIGLNDRLAFIKQLFDGSEADYNRVLSQLSTFNNADEALGFVEQMIKPDYNNWEGKEDYEERFLQLLNNKFN